MAGKECDLMHGQHHFPNGTVDDGREAPFEETKPELFLHSTTTTPLGSRFSTPKLSSLVEQWCGVTGSRSANDATRASYYLTFFF